MIFCDFRHVGFQHILFVFEKKYGKIQACNFVGGIPMALSYMKLWHLLLDKGMKKKDLAEAAGLTDYTMRKLNNNEDVSIAALGKICNVLHCELQDIVDIGSKEGTN